ncbi:MAG: hypothetical protein COB78_12735 [Hyphomicrobiales bacterium]|nr:MAG: hypothetical protein COB78_12735 [Hyphomicrobiales bacterium]
MKLQVDSFPYHFYHLQMCEQIMANFLLISVEQSEIGDLSADLVKGNIQFEKIEHNAMSGEQVVQFAFEILPEVIESVSIILAAYIARGRTFIYLKGGEQVEIKSEAEWNSHISQIGK